MKLPKQIAILLTITLVVTSSGVGNLSYAQSKSTSVVKLAGEDRYETAIEISKSGWSTSNTAIIVNDSSIADALAATPFAKQKNAPILLTKKDNLNEKTKKELKRLGVKNIYLIGGESVLSKNIEEDLKKEKITFERINGNDREETSLKIAQKLDSSKDISEIVVVNGYKGLADAVSIGAVAAEKNIPIILAHPTKGTEVSDKFINEEDIKTSYVIGGENTVSKEIENKLPKAKRISGENRNETNAKVINEFYKNTTLKNGYVAKDGINKEDHLIDALSVGVLAAKNNSPVIIVGNKLDEKQKNVIKSKKFNKITQVGGNGHETIFEEIVQILTPSTGGGGGGSTGGGGTVEDKEQGAPTGLVGHAQSADQTNDGKITGLKSEYEYEYKKLAVERTTSEYTKVAKGSTEISGLEPGTYHVRLAAKQGYKASEPTEVVVGSYIAPTPDPEKSPLEKLEEQIKDVLNKVNNAINTSNINKEKIKNCINNIDSIVQNGIEKNEIQDLINNLLNLLKEVHKVDIDNDYFNNQFSKDVNQIIKTLEEVIRTSEKLQQIKAELEKELNRLHDELKAIVNNKIEQIREFIAQLEEAKKQASEEIKNIIEKVETELNKFCESIKDGVTKEEIQSVITTLDKAIVEIGDQAPTLTQILQDIKTVFEKTLDIYVKVENVIGEVEKIIESIENIDTSSVKGFIETTIVEVNKLPDGEVKNELLKTLNAANEVIKIYEMFEDTINKIKQTDNPLEMIQIISTSGLITKKTISQAKELLEYVEEQTKRLPDGDLKPVAQLGVTALKLVVELVEDNQNGANITTVEDLIKFILNSDSVTLDTMRQARTILISIDNILNKMPDSEIKTQIKDQIKVLKGILDAAIVAGESEEAINIAIKRAEDALILLNNALANLDSIENINKAKVELNNFKSTLKTGNVIIDGILFAKYPNTARDAQNKINDAEMLFKETGIVKGKVKSSGSLLGEGLSGVSVVVKDNDGNDIKKAKTNVSGYFEMELDPGDYKIEFTKENHEKIIKDISVTKQQTISMNDVVLKQLTGTITGFVQDNSQKVIFGGDKALSDCNITVVDISENSESIIKTIKTNKLGLYRIEDIPVGTYEIKFEKQGYISQSINVDITAGEKAMPKVDLKK